MELSQLGIWLAAFSDFGDSNSTMDDQTLTFVLMLIGFVLLGVELLLPTGGIVGVLCACSFLGSAIFAYRAWAEVNPLYWRIYVVTFLALIPITISGVYYLLNNTNFGNRVLLAAPSTEEVTPYQREIEHLQNLIGQRGTALSPLTPGGLVQVNGERLHAIGEGFSIESGVPIEVVSTNGTRVVVRLVAPNEEPLSEDPQDVKPVQKPNPESNASNQPKPTGGILDPFADAETT